MHSRILLIKKKTKNKKNKTKQKNKTNPGVIPVVF